MSFYKTLYKRLSFKNQIGFLKYQICEPNETIFSNKRFILTTTKNKILNSYDDIKTYLKTVENSKSNDNLSGEEQFNSNLSPNRLKTILDKKNRIENLAKELNELKTLVETANDKELIKLAQNDLHETDNNIKTLKIQLIDEIIGDEYEDKDNASLEVSAGVGGQEAMLFCKELFNMYEGYANYRGWKFEKVLVGNTDIGGFRYANAFISGEAVFKYLKFESGVHRVQRVPKTERSGRVHTSTCAVAILPKPEEIEIDINPKDLKFESCRSSGPGGQHVNKTESAIRITHIPTGIVVQCQDERHQYQNRKIALQTLKYKLYTVQFEADLEKREKSRRLQIGSAARSERIRTYNYVQDRITDHRLDENLHNIDQFLIGGEHLNELIESLRYEQSLESLKQLVSTQIVKEN